MAETHNLQPRINLTSEQIDAFGAFVRKELKAEIVAGGTVTPMSLRQLATRCAQRFNIGCGLRHDGVALAPVPKDLPAIPNAGNEQPGA